ncbi:MAG TPA: flagellin [Lachnospiraceae bacterium]|jgi:flagellin|nr:flagellin [Lachnospiraceae bacterium]
MAGVQGVGSSIDYGQIASGKRINSAADDASGLAIANKMESQVTGLDVGAENAQSGVQALNIADGALGGINDYLQRIYELSVKASSGLNSGSDLGAMQKEVDQLLQGISETASNTEYNTMKLIDGSMADMELATNPDGTGQKIQMANATLESLGIDGYNLTEDFDISRISSAMDKVNEARSAGGATTNALESAYRSNLNTSLNTTSAQSRIEDLDIPKAISEQKKNEVIDDYQTMMQKKKMEQEENSVLGLFKF